MPANPKSGGQIPPDGRPAQAPGVGKNAKRHDLEKPKAGLHNTDLQQGEVGQANEMARQITKQRPAQAQTEARQATPAPAGGGALQTPDPRQFIQGRLKNTLQGSPGRPAPTQRIDPKPWLPLIERMATAPNAGGLLAAAYVESLADATGQPRVYTLDMNELDKRVDKLAR